MEQHSALIDAAANGQLSLVRELLDRGADPNETDCDGWSPLHRAVLSGSIDIVTALLDAGANVDSRSPDGATPLLQATLWRNVAIVRALLERGADIHAIDGRGWHALGVALLIEHDELTTLLREHARRDAAPDKAAT